MFGTEKKPEFRELPMCQQKSDGEGIGVELITRLGTQEFIEPSRKSLSTQVSMEKEVS